MARLNIYLPDALATEVRSTEGLNVSAICRDALTVVLRERAQRASETAREALLVRALRRASLKGAVRG